MSSIKNFVPLTHKYDRIVVLVDMDCFYCQVEQKLDPELAGKAIAVVQYNEWQGGGIIAVNYIARALGVTRHMRGDEAKKYCPEIRLCRVPQVRGKADLTKYRDAGKEVAAVLQTFTPLLERASVDEAYMDITERVLGRLSDMNSGKFRLDASKFETTYAVGFDKMGDFVHEITSRMAKRDLETDDGLTDVAFENESEHERSSRKQSNLKLLVAASIVAEIREAVRERTGYECSAGIAHNKIMAKLAAGLNKPNKQTILPLPSIPGMFSTLPLTKVKGLGGKFGEQVCEAYKIRMMAELTLVPKENLIQRFEEKNGNWLFLISRGVDLECVTPKFLSKSIGCCKRFPGVASITGVATLQHWLSELANEIHERLNQDLEENNRTAKQMTISYTQGIGNEDVSSSRTVPLLSYSAEAIAKEALETIKRNTTVFLKPDTPGALNNAVKFLGISAGKFEGNPKTNKIQELFERQKKTEEEAEPKPGESSTSLSEIMARKTAPKFDDVEQKKPKEGGIKSMIEKMKEKYKENLEALSSVQEPKKPAKTKSSLLTFFEEQKKKAKEKLDEEAVPVPGSSNEDDLETSVAVVEKQETLPEPNHSEEPKTDPPNDSREAFMRKLDQSIDDLFEEPEPKAASEDHYDEEQSLKDIADLEATVGEPSRDIPEEPSTSYQASYAEFSTVEPTFTTCEICRERVPEHETLSHADFHVALRISQQQREEYRKEFSPAVSKKSPIAVKPKRSTAKLDTTLKRAPAKLDSFLKKRTSEEPLDEQGEKVKCQDCGRMVSVQSIVEHKDQHLARQLQIEFNRAEMMAFKRKRVEQEDEKNGVKVRPLTAYFSKN